MDECKNKMLHQTITNRHAGTFSKSKKKGLVTSKQFAPYDFILFSKNIEI